MSLESFSTKTARIQMTPNGQILGVAIFLPAEIIEPFVEDGAVIEFELIRMPSGVHIEIEEAVLHD